MHITKQLRFALPLIIFLFIFILLWRGLALHPNLVPSPLIGKPTPAFELPQLLSTKPTSNKDFLGHTTLLNVWATWCSTCAEEHATLLELAENEHIILYGLDYKDDANAAKKWLKENGNPYQLVAFDKMGDVAIDWGVYGTPETFIIDKKGIVRYKQIGAITAEKWEQEIKPLMQKLDAEV
jgi:cytochrome c biogenesis protein CcmG/thiol:disulfide interchange protein DsbE